MHNDLKTIYSKFFNLELNPFGETPDPDFYYASAQHNQALRELVNGIKQGKGFNLLTGEVGTGKTLLGRLLLGSMKNEANTALILYPKFTEIELLQAILDEFEVPMLTQSGHLVKLNTAKSYVDHLNRFLLMSVETGRRSILIIDEAQLLSKEALEMIRLLTNLETKTQKLLQIALIAQPEINATLEQVELRQLKQRIGVHAKLKGLDAIETEKYIRSRIEQAGNGNFIRFETAAVKLIHQLSNGIPRRINQLCEQVLATGEAKRIRLVTVGFAREALGCKNTGKFSIFTKDKTI